MENALVSYLNKRLREERMLNRVGKKAGPVITISREVGCRGLKLAHKISDQLNRGKPGSHWKVLSKEVFQESARELNLDPEKIRQIFKKTSKYTFEEILNAFNNRSYKSERVIVNSVVDIIRTFATDGFCIIVGRAGHVIAKDIEHAFHLRIIAPFEYRTKSIMENNQFSRNEAILFIRKVESERIAFRKAIRAENQAGDYFDLYVNRASFSENDTVDLILKAVEKKGILKEYNYKEMYN